MNEGGPTVPRGRARAEVRLGPSRRLCSNVELHAPFRSKAAGISGQAHFTSLPPADQASTRPIDSQHRFAEVLSCSLGRSYWSWCSCVCCLEVVTKVPEPRKPLILFLATWPFHRSRVLCKHSGFASCQPAVVGIIAGSDA